MKIKVEKSGGFAGISTTNEIEADKLPRSLEGTVRELLNGKRVSISKGLKRYKGAADYINYKITLKDGNKDHIIECNELEIDENMKSLIGYIQKNSEKK